MKVLKLVMSCSILTVVFLLGSYSAKATEEESGWLCSCEYDGRKGI